MGHEAERVKAARAEMEARAGTAEVTAIAASAPSPPDDLAAVLKRSKDKQYFRAAQDKMLPYHRIAVPFDLADMETALSDHPGYVVRYAFE